MHTCPFCDEICDCDMDDTFGLPIPDDCPHVCAEPDFDDDDPCLDWQEQDDQGE